MPPTVFMGQRRADGSWTMQDTDLALALQHFEAGLCSGCGWPAEVAQDPALQRAWKARLPRRCHACTEQAKQVEVYTDEKNGARHVSALRFGVELSPAGWEYLSGGDPPPRTI